MRNKYEEALTYLRNSALVTDHKQKERVNQCKEVLQELIDKTIDEKGNLKVFASICIDEDKMKKICHEAFEKFKEQFVDSYKELLEKYTQKKPDYEGDGYDENGKIIYDTWICPNCNKRYEVDYDDYKYCPNCGQAIDWGDEDD